MLTKTNLESLPKGLEGRFVVIASEYNQKYVDSMADAAVKTFEEAEVSDIELIRVPGAFEIPVIAAEVLQRSAVSAIVCLGVVLRGATTHAQHVCENVSRALMDLQVERRTPLVHEVLLLEDHAQAEKRCLDPDYNRGLEAGRTAVRMAALLQSIRQGK